MRGRLYYAFPEFKSARSCITPVQDHVNVINAQEATNLTKPTQRSESSGCVQVNGNLIPGAVARILNNL